MNRQQIEQNIIKWTYDNISKDFKFRENQLEMIIDIIERIVDDTIQDQIIEAPTGSGKSIICIIAAGVLSDVYGKTSYILCSDTYLWGQYEAAIDKYHLNFGKLAGMSNYTCNDNKMPIQLSTCKLNHVAYNNLRNPDFVKTQGYKCVYNCEYMQNRFKAISANVTLMTYQLWLYQMNACNQMSFEARDVIFCDECHKLSGIVQNYCTCMINPGTDYQIFRDILDFDVSPTEEIIAKVDEIYAEMYEAISNQAFYDAFLKYYSVMQLILDAAIRVQDQYEDLKGKNCLTKKDQEVLKETETFANYYNNLSYFNEAIKLTDTSYIVYTVNKSLNNILLQCAKEDVLCAHFLLCHAKSKVFLSATIGNKEVFDDNIGIKLIGEKSNIDRIDSTFNFEKSPIVFHNHLKMNHANIDKNMKPMSELIVAIISRYKDMKGIIHTGSYKNAEELMKYFPSDIKKRCLAYKGAKNKNELLEIYMKSKDKILIGPTLTEGIDLPGDLCRFNIIMKVPYPNLTDKLVCAKMKLFENWYDSETSMSIIQSIGRGVRSSDDWCHTYILDACFYNLYAATKAQYPVFIQKRFKVL